MPGYDVLVTFTVAALILNFSPGPSNFYVIARSIAQGSRAGIVAALGLSVGGIIYIVAAVFGLSTIFTHSPVLYSAVKLLGAGYLIYLGLQYLKSANLTRHITQYKPQEKPLISIFAESIVVEVTNPKTALFFIALLPQFVNAEIGSVTQQLLILGLIVVVSALPCDLLFAVSSSKVSRWVIKNAQAQRIQQQVSGFILLTLGAYIIGEESVS